MNLNTTTSIVDLMKSLGVDSSFDHRAQLWESKYGSPYYGSPAQNAVLMEKLREFAGGEKKQHVNQHAQMKQSAPIAPYLPFTWMPGPVAMGKVADAAGIRGQGTGAPVPYRLFGHMMQQMAGNNNPYLPQQQDPRQDSIQQAGLFEMLIPFLRMMRGGQAAAGATTIMPQRGLDAAAQNYLSKNVPFTPITP